MNKKWKRIFAKARKRDEAIVREQMKEETQKYAKLRAFFNDADLQKNWNYNY